MDQPHVTLRRMSAEEYATYVVGLEAEAGRQLSETMLEEEARAHARAGIEQYLPDRVDTKDHQLMIAEDEAGMPIGNAWIGPDPHHGGPKAAWLYGIDVYPDARRKGYGSAILRAVEALVFRDGKNRLGLNVVGANEAAIALYQKNGYVVSTQQMTKAIP